MKEDISLTVLTNMYPSKGDVAWRGVFVKEQVDQLIKQFGVNVTVCHIKGAISNGGSTLSYFKWFFLFPVYAIRKNFKLVHSHHFLCTFISKLCPYCRVVYTVHEGELQTNSFKSKLIRLAIKFSDTVIFVNKKMYDLSVHSKKHFLPSGINMDVFNEMDSHAARTRLGLSSEINYLLFPGSPNRKEKNAKFLIDFLKKEKQFVSNKKIEVIWGGGIEYSEMSTYMSAVNILVSFSKFESDGMVFKEAMACNLPVITFDVGNAEMYFGDGFTGSVIDVKTSDFKEKIIYWLNAGRTNGRNKLITLGMDNIEVTKKLYEIYLNKSF